MINISSNCMGCELTTKTNIEEMQKNMGEDFTISKIINAVANMNFVNGQPISTTGN